MRTLAIFFSLLTFLSTAQVPGTISYQGLLTDINGAPVTVTKVNITFNFYTVPTNGTVAHTRTINGVPLFRGMFTVIIGNDSGETGSTNGALPSSIGSTQHYIGIVPAGGSELTPRVALTAVPYAFVAQVAQVANSVAGTNITGTIAGSQIGTGIEATNITTGTIAAARLGIGTNVQAFDDDLTDLADGSLSGSKVGSGVSAANITGALAIANGGTGAATATDAEPILV